VSCPFLVTLEAARELDQLMEELEVTADDARAWAATDDDHCEKKKEDSRTKAHVVKRKRQPKGHHSWHAAAAEDEDEEEGTADAADTKNVAVVEGLDDAAWDASKEEEHMHHEMAAVGNEDSDAMVVVVIDSWVELEEDRSVVVVAAVHTMDPMGFHQRPLHADDGY
jgi:Mg-chelatase subunit ChlI